MNRVFLISIFTILTSVIRVDAQRFTAEIIAGVNGSQVSGDSLGGFDKAGLIAGIGVKTDLNKGFSLGFRMMYFQKGSRKPNKLDEGDPDQYLLRLNYLEIPLMLRYSISSKFFVEAGPSLGYLVSSYEEDEDGEIPFPEPFHDFDFSLAGALGYTLTDKLDFTFGYWQSVVPVREIVGGSLTSYRNQGQYNSVISFSLLLSLRKTGEAGPQE